MTTDTAALLRALAESHVERDRLSAKLAHLEDDAKAIPKDVLSFIRDIATNWDCDDGCERWDGHCRMCDAKVLYAKYSAEVLP